MLARVPIISTYDPSRESMLAYASPSYETAIVITGLVNDCLGQIFLLCYKKLSTKQLTFIISQSTPSFILAK